MIFAITDLETTGGSLKTTKITEIAIVLHDGEKVIDEYSTLINPERSIPPFISRLTGIYEDMVSDAPKFYEVAKKIVEFTEDTVFVAHNVGFDYNVLRQEFKSLGYDFRKPHLCTVRSSRYILPGHASYSLGKLSDDLNITINGRHRAKGDAMATAELFTLLHKTASAEGLQKFIQKEINPKSLHPGLDLAVIDSLPKKTGVYKFINKEEEIIYIGKSKNIRTRVLQHLKNNSSRRAVKMKEAIVRVEYEITGTEVVALLLESELVKELQPIYNRQLRKDRYFYGLYSFIDGNGYLNLFSDQLKNHQTTPYTTFEKKAEANRFLENRCEKFQLCKKLLGLYPTKEACFEYHVKSCLGACVQEEEPESYNERVQEVLKRLSFEAKNFFIVGTGREKSERSLILIENGCYKGYGFIPDTENEGTIENWMQYIEPKKENRDVRRIIQSYLRNTEHPQIRSFGNF